MVKNVSEQKLLFHKIAAMKKGWFLINFLPKAYYLEILLLGRDKVLIKNRKWADF